MLYRKVLNCFSIIALVVWNELPLFVMLVMYITVPALFAGGSFSFFFVCNVLPQAVLPALLLCWLASIRRWLWWIVFTISNMLFLIELGCYFCMSSRLNSLLAVLLLQTNINESIEFLQFANKPILKSIIVMAAVAVGILVWQYLWKKVSKKLRIKNFWTSVCLHSFGLILFFLVGISLFQIIKSVEFYSSESQQEAADIKRSGMMRYASCPVVYYFIVKDMLNNPRTKSLDRLDETLSNLEVDCTNEKDSLNIIFVIGESLARNKSSLFGYEVINNSPKLMKEKDNGSLFIFDNMISETHQTIGVVPYMMSTCSVTHPEHYGEYPLLPAILKKGGYHVRYFDNQSILGATHKFDFRCTYFFARENVRKKSLDEYNDRDFEYDGQMIEAYPPLWDKSKNLTIYHLMGNHVEAAKRYPKAFDVFGASDYDGLGYSQSQVKFVSEYDNATLYNDYVLSQAIERIRNDIAILIYVSDHGDEVFDYANRDCRGRNLAVTNETARVFCEVPAIIWVSDRYKELYSKEMEVLRGNIHKPLYNTDIVHTIIDITGIETASFRSELSLLREGQGRTNRIIQRTIYYDRDRNIIDSHKMRYEK